MSNEDIVKTNNLPQPVKDLKIGLILLAAGESSRLKGTSKQLLKLNHKTLIRQAAEVALASVCSPICVVLGAKSDEIKREVEDLQIEIVINENWKDGMSSSLKIGLEKLHEIEPNLGAVIIQLCDQPFITTEVINELDKTFKESKAEIVACEYSETVGVPALFAVSMFRELLNLSSESGAKQIIKKNFSKVEKISVPEAAIDIDTSEDYENLISAKRGL